ncbi:MAG: UDP-N-acetylmuramoyl-L-alanine--D-glutamate ligase [Acidimicrobiales bacterium]|nr:UDP-N-acetylmuramoyl-L-alanine--D-glutamate ligase [Acidimicrobiales bacterium]
MTGRAVVAHLGAIGQPVAVLDDAPGPEQVKAGEALGVEVEHMPRGEDAIAARLSGVEMIVPSPGVPVGHPVFAAARRLGVPVRSEIELASEAARRAGRPALIAITGTNGKTTVTTLVTAILQQAGLHVAAAGNIGTPLIEAVAGGSDIVVAEISSFQLQFTELFHPAVSCWLNLAPDHLDWHDTIDHYAAAKARIWANQTSGDAAAINADDHAVAEWARTIPPGVRRITWSVEGPADFVVSGGRLVGPGGVGLIEVSELPRAFPHDVSNALAAAAVATAAGASPDACRSGLVGVVLLPHRVSLVAEDAGVRWYDDSKATTPASVLAAVAGFESVVLIAGGRNKGLDLTPLAGTVPPVRAVVAIGEAGPEVAAVFDRLAPVRRAASMDEAVQLAAQMARPGDSVLLSPGCASFDWYLSYAARGDDFAAAVRTHLRKGGAPC